MNIPLKYRQISSVFVAALMIVCFCALSGQNAAAGVSDDLLRNDSDYDRMPDAWEIEYGLNPNMPDGNADEDGDGFSNYVEYTSYSDPGDPLDPGDRVDPGDPLDPGDRADARSAPIIVRGTIPPQRVGASRMAPFANTVSFAVLVSSTLGVDLTNPDSIRFSVDDEHLPIYERDLSANSVRVVKLNDDDDSRATLFWAIYDRSREVDISAVYAADAIISIGVDIRDGAANLLTAGEFDFKIESLPTSAKAAQGPPQTAALDPSDPLLAGDYDRGIQVVAGPLKGAKILYSSLEPMPPVIGPILETAGVEADGVEASGPPLNLKPDTVFNTPVRIFLPVADDVETDNLGVYFHNGLQWQPGCYPDGVVSDAGLGWMRSESRVILKNHDPVLIGIDVRHFSATQTVIFAQFNGDRHDDNPHNRSGGTVYVSCFITAAAGQSPIPLSVLLILFLVPATIYGLKTIIANYSQRIGNSSRRIDDYSRIIDDYSRIIRDYSRIRKK
jgi:hypothetical protein